MTVENNNNPVSLFLGTSNVSKSFFLQFETKFDCGPLFHCENYDALTKTQLIQMNMAGQ